MFEGLLPGIHNDIVLDVLFDLATWHAYAKLHLHTDRTLEFFEMATAYLGKSVRKFQQTTCLFYHTTELPQECASRGRKMAALAAKQGHAVISTASGPKHKTLNLSTYKFHALGDYPLAIRHYGTTDNYTTQIVSLGQRHNIYQLIQLQGELEHRCVKRRYPRSGKKKNGMVRSITNQEAIERFIRKVNDAREDLHKQSNPRPKRLRTSPLDHYYIANSAWKRQDLIAWLGERRGDPAFEVSLFTYQSPPLLTNLLPAFLDSAP